MVNHAPEGSRNPTDRQVPVTSARLQTGRSPAGAPPPRPPPS